VAAISSDLPARLAADELDGLRRRFGRSLRDNAEGEALLHDALQEAVAIGFEAWSEIEGRPDAGSTDGDVWARWQAQRQLTPEAAAWPERLAVGSSSVASTALEAAEEAMLAAGAELGLIGAGRGRGARRVLREAGAQAAEAGAALCFALDDADDDPLPVVATAAPDLAVPPRGDTVRVATAANSAECELLQGRLRNAGIPSTWSRSGDVPDLLAAGYRDIYVALDAAADARVVLAVVDASALGVEEEPPTQRVGLERSWLRRIGKTAILLYVVGVMLTTVTLGLLFDVSVGGATLAYLAIAIGMMVWSERR
jgi:hypothetical protein